MFPLNETVFGKMSFEGGNTNFDDITPLIANFLDTTSFTVETGGVNSIRRCISAG